MRISEYTLHCSMIENFDAFLIPTNGVVTKTGANVMGKGIALEIKKLSPCVDIMIGKHLIENGNIPCLLPFRYKMKTSFITFPTKNNFVDNIDMALFRKSTRYIRTIVDENNLKNILLPYVGCGCAKGNKEEILKYLQEWFDDRFIISEMTFKSIPKAEDDV